MPALAAASAGIQAAKGVYDIFDSINKKRQANKIRKDTKRPIYEYADELDEVSGLLKSEINDTTLQDYATQTAAQGLGAGIDAILKSGGKADFSTVYNSYGSNLNTALQTLKRNRSTNIAASNNAEYAKARGKDTEFQYNKDAPYKDAMQQSALLDTQAAKAKADAFTNLSGAAANFATMGLKPGDVKTDGGRAAENSEFTGAGSNPVSEIWRQVDTGTNKDTGTTLPLDANDPAYQEFLAWKAANGR